MYNALNWECLAYAFIYSLVNESISFFFFLVIPSGTNLLPACVAQTVKEKYCASANTDLASKEYECEK